MGSTPLVEALFLLHPSRFETLPPPPFFFFFPALSSKEMKSRRDTAILFPPLSCRILGASSIIDRDTYPVPVTTVSVEAWVASLFKLVLRFEGFLLFEMRAS